MNWAEATKDMPINPVFQQGAKTQEPAAPASEGEKAQEHADPAKADDIDNSAQDPENSAAPAGDSEENGEDPAQSGEDDGSGKEMSKEERAANAARRREEQNKALVDKAVAKEREKFEAEKEKLLDDGIAALKLVNPYTGKPINSRADLTAFDRQRNEAQFNDSVDKLGIPRDILASVVENHPAILEAKKIAEKADGELRRVLDEKAETRFNEQLTEIQKYDKNIKTFTDFRALTNYSEIRALVDAGLSISKAYKVVNEDAVLEHERKAARQEALNAVNSKGHLKSGDASQGAGGIEVPPEVAQSYRNNYPGISYEEIQKKYSQVQSFYKKG